MSGRAFVHEDLCPGGLLADWSTSDYSDNVRVKVGLGSTRIVKGFYPEGLLSGRAFFPRGLLSGRAFISGSAYDPLSKLIIIGGLK